MRFSSAQLRMLQESLAPALPNLSPPPEMVAAHAPAQAHALHAHAAQEAPRQTAVVGVVVPCVYGCCLATAAYAGAYWSVHVPVLSASPLPLALAAHALFAAHSRVAQFLGLACAVLLPAACASPWPDLALLGVAALCSAFFAAATQGSGLVRSVSAALAILLAFLACCAAITEAQTVRYTISLFVAMLIYGQSVMSGASVGQFALICAVKT
jgi:hypothetical protein